MLESGVAHRGVDGGSSIEVDAPADHQFFRVIVTGHLLRHHGQVVGLPPLCRNLQPANVADMKVAVCGREGHGAKLPRVIAGS